MRGRAHKGLGEIEKYQEDVRKAMNFFKTIAQVKFGKELWEECMEFCILASILGEENGLQYPQERDPELLELSSKAFEKARHTWPDTIKRQEKALKLSIKGCNLDVDLKDIAVQYNSDTKEFVVNINQRDGHHRDIRFMYEGFEWLGRRLTLEVSKKIYSSQIQDDSTLETPCRTYIYFKRHELRSSCASGPDTNHISSAGFPTVSVSTLIAYIFGKC